jgi:formate/nitrite transporter FocA (FNT family)
MVLIAGSELFTGNCLIIISVLEREATWGGMFKNWVVVFIGNFVGSLLVGAAVVYGHTLSLFGNELARAAIDTAAIKTGLTFTDAFIRGILCNMWSAWPCGYPSAQKALPAKYWGCFSDYGIRPMRLRA